MKNSKNTKLIIPFFLVSLLLVPGCWFKKQPVQVASPVVVSESVPEAADMTPTAFEQEAISVQEPDVESFIIQENKENPFVPSNANEYEEVALDDISENVAANDDSQKFEPIYFNFDEKNIRGDQENVVNKNLESIKNSLKEKEHNIVVEGHACDSAGSAQYNLLLSEDRANTIKDFFIKNGINEKSIKIVGRGSECLIVPFGTREQQAPNRRVEIYAYRQ